MSPKSVSVLFTEPPIPEPESADAAPTEIDRLWMEFKRTSDRELRDRLILHYSPLAKYVAARVAAGLPQSVDQSDLVSYGIFGLIDAIEKFDLERGYKFETYAIARIKGAILDELRSIDWVPRSVRAKARSLEKAFMKLEGVLHRSPTDDELAAEMRVTPEQLQATLGADLARSASSLSTRRCRSATAAKRRRSATRSPIAETARSRRYEVEEMRHILATAINTMPEREKIVLTLYYYEGLTLAEIGLVLGVTESRVCQIHTKAVLHLRARLSAGDRDAC